MSLKAIFHSPISTGVEQAVTDINCLQSKGRPSEEEITCRYRLFRVSEGSFSTTIRVKGHFSCFLSFPLLFKLITVTGRDLRTWIKVEITHLKFGLSITFAHVHAQKPVKTRRDGRCLSLQRTKGTSSFVQLWSLRWEYQHPSNLSRRRRHRSLRNNQRRSLTRCCRCRLAPTQISVSWILADKVRILTPSEWNCSWCARGELLPWCITLICDKQPCIRLQ